MAEQESPKLPKQEEDRYPDEAAQIAASFTDTYYVNIWPGALRIAFGEALRGKAFYRTAVVIPIDDAKALANDILELIVRLESDEKKKKK